MKKITLLVTLLMSLIVASCKHDEAEKLFAVEKDGQWGFIDKSGKFVIEAKYDILFPFSCGVALFFKDGKCGYINSRGKVVIEPVYRSGTSFSEGKAFVCRPGNVIECINLSGKTLFSLTDETAVNFHEGLARIVSRSGKWGYVDKKGRWVIEPIYDEADNFFEGFAYVKKHDEPDSFYGFINKKNERKINTEYGYGRDRHSYQYHCFSEGLVEYSRHSCPFGYINKKGETIIPFQFRDAWPFNEGLACVATENGYGCIDKKGDFVINPEYKEPFEFSEGMACVRKGDEYGYIDNKGKVVLGFTYDKAFPFHGDYAVVWERGKGYGLIDKKGDFVVEPQFSDIRLDLAIWTKTDFQP